MVDLAPWEEIIRAIIHGSLISGLILFIFSFFVNLGHDVHHDSNIDIDADADIDIGMDIDHDISIGIDADHDIDIGNIEGSIDTDHDIGHGEVHSITDSTPAPFLLLLSSFMLSFGGIGEILYSININSLLRLIIAILIPIIVTKFVSLVWRRLTGEETYEIPTIKIDNQIVTLTEVDEKGGLVIADTSDIERPQEKLHLMGRIKMHARTIPGNQAIPKGKIGYVIGIENNTLIIDEWPSPPKKAKGTQP